MPKKEPLISVIIPAKNEENNILRLLKSIKNQSYKNIETIVVDDGSTDKTAELSLKYTSKVYKRTHAERSVQRNYGAEKSKGEYLVFLDADMELTSKVIEDSLNTIRKSSGKLLVIPEQTVGDGLLTQVRRFEREMYMGDLTIEVARFFDREVFFEFKGYDVNLTGPEDYDLPYRISKKYKIFRSKEYILHHEQNVSFSRLLKRKFYYASKGALYASKHPELVKSQGNLLFRSSYLKNWKKFVKNPIIGVFFVFVRICEAISAVLGYIHAVGVISFLKTVKNSFL